MEWQLPRRQILRALHASDIQNLQLWCNAAAGSEFRSNALLIVGDSSVGLRELVDVLIAGLAVEEGHGMQGAAYVSCRLARLNEGKSLVSIVERITLGSSTIVALLDVDEILEGSVLELKIRHLLDTTSAKLVLATGTKKAKIAKSLLRSERLSHEYVVPIPSKDRRCDALHAIAGLLHHELTPELIAELSSAMPAFTYIDVVQLYHMTDARLSTKEECSLASALASEIAVLRPCILRFPGIALTQESLCRSPSRTQWESIQGYEEVKRVIDQLIEWPLVHQETFKRLGIDAPSGLLLQGPSG